MSKIDTSTTAGKIKVQQAWIDGRKVYYRSRNNLIPYKLNAESEPTWNWSLTDYYIRPQTVEEAAGDYCKKWGVAFEQKRVANDFIAGARWKKEQGND